jgi:hypothetical protein
VNSNGKVDFPDNDLQEELDFIGQREFDLSPNNRFSRKPEGKTKSGKGNTRQVWKCHYKYESGCKFQICVIRDNDKDLSRIFIGNLPHCPHKKRAERGLSSTLKAAIVGSPMSLRRRGTKSLVAKAMSEKKIRLDKQMQKKAARYLYRMKEKLEKDILGGLDAKTFEGLDRKLHSLKMTILRNLPEFDEDTYYVCGDHVCEGNEMHGGDLDARLAVLFSTDNLLLNIYRQWCTGYDLTFSVDTSYRYTVQGYGLLPVRVTDFSQTSHVVGYGLVNKEDVGAHNYLFYQLKTECEKVVAHYRDIDHFDFR